EYLFYQNNPGIHFIPPVTHDKMAALYQTHDLVIGQFKIDSLGMVELESMACARRIICHYIENQWYTTPPPVLKAQSASQIAENIIFLIKNPSEMVSLGEKGRVWVTETHDYRLIARHLIEIYEQNL